MNPPWLTPRYYRRMKYFFENIDEILENIKGVVEEELGIYEMYLFGSYVDGDYTLASDIDILIVSPKAPRRISDRARIVTRILSVIGDDAPIEIHIITPGEFKWYKRFIRKLVRV